MLNLTQQRRTKKSNCQDWDGVNLVGAPKRTKFVRFQDWSPERSLSSEQQFSLGDTHPRRGRLTIYSVLKSFQTLFKSTSERRRVFNIWSKSDQPTKKVQHQKKVLDPQGKFLQKWNKIQILLCVIAVSLDPLFFYVPVMNSKQKCLDLDNNLEIIACVLRSFTDICYILHILIQFRTSYIAPYSRVFGRGVLISDLSAISRRYFSSYFFVDVLSVLPLPQMVILFKFMDGPVPLTTKDMLKYVIFVQYVPRLTRIYPLYREVTTTSGILTETAWAGAVFNLLLYMLASHVSRLQFIVVGAFWYLFSIEREVTCWSEACHKINCNDKLLYCDMDVQGDKSFMEQCPLVEADNSNSTDVFNFGIFLDVLKSEVVASNNFPKKFFYCFWWGLRSLSCLGQNLETSTFVGEIIFAVCIAIAGLVLFSLLIGNMQKYLQSATVRVEEMRIKRRDAERWMSHRLLPEDLRERIRRYEQYKWQETRGVEEEPLIRSLPKDLRRDIRRHLFMDLLKRVPMIEKMDDQLLDAMCDCLKPVLYTEESLIHREGDPVDEMLFIMRGKLVTVTTNGGRTGFLNSDNLKAGDFCGDELLSWALDPQSSNLPISTRTVKALTEVEAFALLPDDLKFVASQFRRLNSAQIQQTFKYHKKKLEDALREEEDRLQDALAREGGSTSSLGAIIYASKFAANALRLLRHKGTHRRVPDRVPPLLLQKPAVPDFHTEKN
ncbi:Ion transport domain [Dillenia turbinata]|uniref:Ion transport domain n=1 Tax=Dillenia turbinata TaxID=194707 RepID=A0AAN8V2X1_9MAGN